MEKLMSRLPGGFAETVKSYSDRFKSRKDSDTEEPARIITQESGEGKFRWLKITILVFAVLCLGAGVLYLMGLLRIP